MSEQSKRVLLGVLLVVAGGVFLLQQLLDIPVGGLFIALLFIIAGCVFLYFLLKDREKWWLVIPGFTLIGIGSIIAMDKLFPQLAGRFGGSVFLAAVALSFLAVYILKPAQWWPIIPAGILITLALVAGLGGSFVGGLLASLLAGDGLAFKPSGIIGSNSTFSDLSRSMK